MTGVPEIHFLDGEGNEIRELRIIGFLGPEDFIRRIELALKPGSRKGLPGASD